MYQSNPTELKFPKLYKQTEKGLDKMKPKISRIKGGAYDSAAFDDSR